MLARPLLREHFEILGSFFFFFFFFLPRTNTANLLCFTFTLEITKRKYPKWDLGKGFFFKAFIKSEQLRRLLNDQNDWYNVLGNGRWFWKKNLMTPSMAYSVSVWFISATNGCYESDDISLKWIRSVIPSGSFVIFYPNPILFLFLWPFDVLVKNIEFFFQWYSCTVIGEITLVLIFPLPSSRSFYDLLLIYRFSQS